MQIQVDSEVLRQMAIAMSQFELDAQSLITTEVSALHGRCAFLIDRCRQHILEIEYRLQFYRTEVSNCEKKILQSQQEIQNCQHRISQCQVEVLALERKVSELRLRLSKLNSGANAHQVEPLKKNIEDYEKEVGYLRGEIQRLQSATQDHEHKIRQLRTERDRLMFKISEHEMLIPKMEEIINHAQLIQGRLVGVRLNTDACVRGRTHLLHLAGIIDEFQSTPLPTEATFTPYSFVSSSVNEAPIFDQQFPRADNVALNNNQEPFYCPQHGIPLQVCPYCGEGRSPLDALLDPTNLFRSDEAAERYRQLLRCEYCSGTGRYCPECISQS